MICFIYPIVNPLSLKFIFFNCSDVKGSYNSNFYNNLCKIYKRELWFGRLIFIYFSNLPELLTLLSSSISLLQVAITKISSKTILSISVKIWFKMCWLEEIYFYEKIICALSKMITAGCWCFKVWKSYLTSCGALANSLQSISLKKMLYSSFFKFLFIYLKMAVFPEPPWPLTIIPFKLPIPFFTRDYL